jgi:hypothetical protein
LQNVSSVVEMSRSFKNKVFPIHSKIKIASALKLSLLILVSTSGIAFLKAIPLFFQTGRSSRGIIDIMLLTVPCGKLWGTASRGFPEEI